MKLVCDLSVTSARNRPRTATVVPPPPPPAPWYAPYQPTGLTAAPSLVLDFEAGVYGAGGIQTSFSNLVTFSRASTATGQTQSGGTQSFAMNVPVFDWSTGRQGLLLRPTGGGRSADVASVRLGSWWSAAMGTVLVEARLNGTNTDFDRVVEIHDGGTSNRISLLFTRTVGQMTFGVYRQGMAQAALLGTQTGYAIQTPLSARGVFGQDDFRFRMNGGSELSDTSGVVPSSVNVLQLGARADNGNHGDLVIYRITLFGEKL